MSSSICATIARTPLTTQTEMRHIARNIIPLVQKPVDARRVVTAALSERHSPHQIRSSERHATHQSQTGGSRECALTPLITVCSSSIGARASTFTTSASSCVLTLLGEEEQRTDTGRTQVHETVVYRNKLCRTRTTSVQPYIRTQIANCDRCATRT